MCGGRHDVLELVAAQADADGQSAAQTLGDCHQVGLDAVVLVGKELAGSANAGLHLVHDQQNVVLFAERRDRLHIVFVEDVHAAFALHHLEHHGADALVDVVFEVVKVVRLGVFEALGKGEEVVVKNVLTGCRQRGDGSAVEGILEGDDHIAIGAVAVKAVFSCDFDRAFVRLGAAVAKADLGESRQLAERFGEVARLFAVKIVGHVLDGACLRGDGLEPAVVAVAQRVDADAGADVKIALAVLVIGDNALAAFERDVVASVGMHDILQIFFFCVHNVPPELIAENKHVVAFDKAEIAPEFLSGLVVLVAEDVRFFDALRPDHLDRLFGERVTDASAPVFRQHRHMVNKAASAVVTGKHRADDLAVDNRHLRQSLVAFEIPLHLGALVGGRKRALAGDLPHGKNLIIIFNSHSPNNHKYLRKRDA